MPIKKETHCKCAPAPTNIRASGGCYKYQGFSKNFFSAIIAKYAKLLVDGKPWANGLLQITINGEHFANSLNHNENHCYLDKKI
jgi:hypothetical protein